MKRIFLFSIVLSVLAVSANAQFFQYGLKAGVNFSSLAMEDIKGLSSGTEVYDLLAGDNVRGYQAGLMTRINIAMVLIQPEVYFNVTGGAVEKLLENGTSELLQVKFSRIDIPLLVGVKLGPARINVGPVGSAVLSSVNEIQELVTEDIEAVSSGLTWGFQAGVGLDLFKKLAIDARYEGSISQYGASSVEIGGLTHNFDTRPKQWILTLGWWF